ncbi:TPA: SH3 domain-containing protein [Salmonella enterica subsp. enterica]|uniref:SH3 domain-containing protein n=1 Tax=Salmonella enterica TaxID=28901 RepID=UPI001A2B91C0|nr:SH3 domain-containing protein [Salmonella enterica]MBJ5598130.1 hypothetical protein [Salmonella enterica subsp. enterica serovar Thompson]EHI8697893.1 hypothetical protein [Salmonella enterica]EHI8699821.1 hypothetical protein [Salmonella enterica]MBJ5607801.1 hypothetical protein [Salmonella enterica subsp. enterica serovar Thompson]MBJ5612481.1 hypothetical protein [Salmonella enterica subsp. enterica serovar Thompson]
MTAPLRFTARDSHLSEYPDPISFTRGTSLIIHEKYEGVEEWDNWFYCTIPGHTGGWVPGQILTRDEGTYRGLALEDYTARELEVKKGDELVGLKSLNGWMWCERLSDGQSGWVPLSLLHQHTTDN